MLAAKGSGELSPVAVRHRTPTQPVAGRPPPRRQVESAEQPIEQRKMDRKVLVERLALDRVMEVVDSRRDEKWLQPGEIAPDVGVYPHGVEGNEDQIRRHHRSRDASPGQCKEHADPNE